MRETWNQSGAEQAFTKATEWWNEVRTNSPIPIIIWEEIQNVSFPDNMKHFFNRMRVFRTIWNIFHPNEDSFKLLSSFVQHGSPGSTVDSDAKNVSRKKQLPVGFPPQRPGRSSWVLGDKSLFVFVFPIIIRLIRHLKNCWLSFENVMCYYLILFIFCWNFDFH